MSSDTFIAYFGLRFEVAADEVEAVELRSDRRVIAARKAGLKYYFGNFGGLQEQYLLFIGDQIGILGEENSQEIIISVDSLGALFSRTREKLEEGGFFDSPRLYLKLQPDV